MSRPAWVVRSGRVPFDVANDGMHRLAELRISGGVPDTFVVAEHPPVFTAGRRSRPEELLWSEAEIDARGAEVHRIDRGGAFTFHGPGQLVVYPIFDLGRKPDVSVFLRRLEEVVIRSAADVGVHVHRRDDVQTGVWADNDKVCAIGVRLMRARVTLHGFALNCDTDLSWFDGIVACGLPDHGVVSLSRLAGRVLDVDVMRPLVERHVSRVFGLHLEPASGEIAAMFRADVPQASASASASGLASATTT
jgi:lipoyl(octanoyl) transferase